MRKIVLIFGILFFALPAFAQSTTVTATITDSSGQVWTNGNYSFSFFPSPINPAGPYFWAGSPFNMGTLVSGALNSSGTFTVSVPSNSAIAPANSQWKITVCPQATATCYSTNLTITGATQNISAAVIPPPIAVNAQTVNQISAYKDAQIINPYVGTTYYNLTDSTVHVCSGPTLPCTWVSIGSGGGGGSPPASPAAALQFANASVTGFATVNCLGNALSIDNIVSPTTLTNPCILTQEANAIFGGPNPYIDITSPPYNARAVTINSTGTGSGTALTVAVTSFKNGDGITISGGGPSATVTTPNAPTVVPGEAESETVPDAFMTTGVSGSSTYKYTVFAEDVTGGVSAASPVTTITTGPAALGETSIALSAISQTGRTLSFTSSTPHGLVQNALAHITAGSNSYYLSQWDIIQTITDSTHASAPLTVANSGSSTVSAASGTLVYFVGNNVTFSSVTNAYRYWVCVQRPGDSSLHIIGTALPGTTQFVDFGATLSSNPIVPWYISNSNCTAGASQPQLDSDTVLAGGGSTALTLKNGLTVPVSGAAVRLDNHSAIAQAQIAAIANPSAAAGIYIPTGTFPINSAIGWGGTSIQQAGNLVVNAPLLPTSGTRWSGEWYKGTTAGNLPPFANDSPPLVTCNSNPCIDMNFFGGQPFYIANLAIFGPSTGNGVLMVTAPRFTGKFFNLQMETGNTVSDNMGIAIYMPPGSSFPYECDWCSFTGGPGQVVDQTWTPFVYLEGSSAGASGIILHGGNLSRRGIFSKSHAGGGNQIHADDIYTQGMITPLFAFENNFGSDFPTLTTNHVHQDTEQQSMLAIWSTTGQGMFLAYNIGVANNPQSDGGGNPSMVTGSGSSSSECYGGRLDDSGPNGLFTPCVGFVFDQQNLNATNPVTAPGLTVNGLATATNIVDSSLTPGTGPICPNGSAGALTTVGCTGGGSAFQANGSPLSSGTTVNFQNSAAFNGVTFTFNNPSSGNVQLGATGQFTNAALANTSTTVNGQSCVLGAACNLPLQVNGTNNTSLSGLNLINSTVNAGGLTATFSNPGTNQTKLEITGTANLAANLAGCIGSVAGDVCLFNGTSWNRLAGNNSGTQYLSENASGSPAWGIPAGAGSVTNPLGSFSQYEPMVAANGTAGVASVPASLDAGLQTGATADVQLNNCNTNTITANIGQCDARDLTTSSSLTLAAQVNVGNGTPYPTTLVMPGNSTWLTNTSFTGGTSCAIFQNGSTSITGSEAPLKMKVQSASGSGGLKSLYCNNGGGYYRLDHVTFYNPTTPTASNIGANITGGFDGSRWSDWAVIDYQDAVALQVSHICCSAALENTVVNTNFTGHIPLNWVSDNTGTINGAGTFNISLGHPAAGFSAFSLSDTSTVHNSSTWHFGTYVEGSNVDTNTPIVSLAGSGAATFVGEVFKSEASNSVAPAFSVSNAFNTCLTVMGLSMVGGGGTWIYPATGVANNFTGHTFATDANGNFGIYSACPSYFETLSAWSFTDLGIGTGNVCATAGTLYTSGCTGGGGGGPGTGTPSALAVWNPPGTGLNSVLGTITGQIPVAQNGSPVVFQSPGIAGSTISASTPYTIQCDSSTTVLDRLRSLIFTSAAGVTVTVPDAGTSGCGGNFTFTLGAGPGVGTVTVNRTTSSTFTILDGTSALAAQTSFTMAAGEFATISSPDNANYLVRITEGGGGSGTFGGFSSGNLSPLFTTSVANPTTSPAQTFTLSNAGANTVLGNPTGSSAAPVYTSTPSVTGITVNNSVTIAGGAGALAAITFAANTKYILTSNDTETTNISITNPGVTIECADGIMIQETTASTALFTVGAGSNNFTMRNCGLAPPVSGSAGHLVEDTVLTPVSYIRLDNVTLNANSSTATTGSGWVDIRGGSHHFVNAIGLSSAEVFVQVDNQSGTTHNAIDDVRIRGNYVETGAGKQAINVLPNTNGSVKRIDTDITCSTVDVCVAYVGNASVYNGSVKGTGVWTAIGSGIMWHLACANCVIGPIDANDGGFNHSTANLLSVTDGYNNVIQNISLTTTSNHGQPFQLIDNHDSVVDGLVVGGARGLTVSSSATTSGWDPAQPAVKVASDAASTVSSHNTLSNIIINAPPSFTGDAIQITCPFTSAPCDANTVGSGVKITAVSATGNAINILAAGTSATALNETICPSSITGFATGVSVTSPATANICQIKMVSVTTPWSCGTAAGCLINDLSTGVAFASIPANLANGSTLFLTDGTIGATCAGSGSGAFLRRINGANNCN